MEILENIINLNKSDKERRIRACIHLQTLPACIICLYMSIFSTESHHPVSTCNIFVRDISSRCVFLDQSRRMSHRWLRYSRIADTQTHKMRIWQILLASCDQCKCIHIYCVFKSTKVARCSSAFAVYCYCPQSAGKIDKNSTYATKKREKICNIRLRTRR